MKLKRIIRLAPLVLVFTISRFAGHAQNEFIVGGVEIEINEAPWTVSIKIVNAADNDHAMCTGVYIGDKWVMTAGHCVDSQNLFIKVKYGLTDICEVIPNNRINVVRYYVHPDFETDNYDNDIALLELERSLEDEVIPIDYGVLECDNGCVTSYGWGLVDDGTQSCILHKGHPDELLSGFFDSQLIYSADIESIDLGDSGGPLVATYPPAYEPILVGITSTTTPLSLEQNFTNVFYYQDWIDDVLQGEIEGIETEISNPPIPRHTTSNIWHAVSLTGITFIAYRVGAEMAPYIQRRLQRAEMNIEIERPRANIELGNLESGSEEEAVEARETQSILVSQDENCK